MRFSGPLDPPSGKGPQSSRAAGLGWDYMGGSQLGRKVEEEKAEQNSFIDELTFMELPSVSRSRLKLQRRSRGYIMELSASVTSELRSEITLVPQRN